MSVIDDCDDCTDESICRRHLLMGILLTAVKTAPDRVPD